MQPLRCPIKAQRFLVTETVDLLAGLELHLGPDVDFIEEIDLWMSFVKLAYLIHIDKRNNGTHGSLLGEKHINFRGSGERGENMF